MDTLEERARTDMGMVKEGETFFLFLKITTNPNDHCPTAPPLGANPRCRQRSSMQAAKPKQYLPLAGKTLLEVTLSKFVNRADIDGLVLVTAEV